ncbi:MAG: 3'-5' exonuclease [Anaerolineales bacterium]|nr:MAG: 3'-5' exonuclease [Anaerolineales bacterium]
MPALDPVYISVDVETAGPNPNNYALLSIGACRVDQPEISFYLELQPDRDSSDTLALEISGLDLKQLEADGVPALEAMLAFETWVLAQKPAQGQIVLVAFNAPFDWMFIADYFHRYLGRNPFGHRALDIKALYMGKLGVAWEQTGMAAVSQSLGTPLRLSHNALEDARDQARIFKALMETERKKPENEEIL